MSGKEIARRIAVKITPSCCLSEKWRIINLLDARRPVLCVPLTPAHQRRRSQWCREHRNWRDNEWGRVLFTDESRFSLSSDSHRILIWREREAAIIPRTSLKGQVWRSVFSLGEASRLVVHRPSTSSTQVQSTVTRYCNEILLPYVRLFRGAMGLQFLFMDDNAPMSSRIVARRTDIFESEDIERTGLAGTISGSQSHRACMGFSRQTLRQLVPTHQ
ncbi:HTH_Tnp_Tc3_2 domain-containing protein [Trichonephila clavipes]|nr:HTH_Tnp_Tc3_2 domain-containing protein [Trichonephila clavipes]